MILSKKGVRVAGVLALVSVGVFMLWADLRAADDAKGDAARVAAIKHIMKGIHQPNCAAIANALKDGPKDDKAWDELALNAALLNESGHLLMQNNRCPDGTWKDATEALRNNAAKVAQAAMSKKLQEARTSFKGVTAACGTCHKAHKKPV